jgi:glucose/mannose-6-phosphate isomerase
MPTAKQLAWAMFGRIPIVFGAGAMTAVAHRWKTQLNENAKAWAMFEPMPEANHNAIEGTLNPRELSDALYVVELRERDEPEHIGARYRVVEELLATRDQSQRGWAEGRRLLRVPWTQWPWATSSAYTWQSSTRPTRRRLHCWQC